VSTRARNVVVALAVGVSVVLGAFLLWFQAGIALGLGTFLWGAQGLQSHLTTSAEDLANGDYAAGLQEHQASVRSTDLMEFSVGLPQVRFLGDVPYVTTAIRNWEAAALAASDIADSTGGLLSIYGDLSGDAGGERVFRDGSINLALLRSLPARLELSRASLDRAQSRLSFIRASTPMAQPLNTLRDRALREMRPVRQVLRDAERVVPVLPRALGADGPKRYLVAIANQAEMRASAGAPLTLVMVEFAGGAISTPIKGQTSTELFPPLNAPVRWFGPGLNPFFPDNPRFDPFVVTNTHPNLLYSAQEMAASWAGRGFPAVDGVFIVDLTAIAAVLNATGPIESAAYGTVDGEQLGQILLVDAYAQFGQEEAVARQQANQQLLDELLGRLLSGDDVLTVAGAIVSTAPGRHFQAWLTEPALENLAIQAGAAGIVTDPRIGDWSAMYTQNGNQSKVDVFQERNTFVQVQLADDGSARVRQILTITNATPPDRPEGPPERIGYETMWVKNAYLMYVPDTAQDIRAEVPQDFVVRPFKGHARQQVGGGFVRDGFGHRLVRAVGWTAPGGTSQLGVSYTLPPGTFLSQERLVYRLRVEPQAVFRTPTVTLQVTAPVGWQVTEETGMTRDGVTTSVSAVADRPVEIGMEFTRSGTTP
jgi:hypothetical protein